MSTKPFVFGIAGPSGSGKTLLVNNLLSGFQYGTLSVLREDSYYKDQSHLSVDERENINYDHPDVFEHDLMLEHLVQLVKGQSINVPIYDFKTHTRQETTNKEQPAQVILVDGILLLTQEKLRSLFDISIFIDAPLDACLIRRIQRDIQERGRDLNSIITQYQKTVRPMYWKYIYPSREFADVVVTGGGNNWKAIDLISSKIEGLLG